VPQRATWRPRARPTLPRRRSRPGASFPRLRGCRSATFRKHDACTSADAHRLDLRSPDARRPTKVVSPTSPKRQNRASAKSLRTIEEARRRHAPWVTMIQPRCSSSASRPAPWSAGPTASPKRPRPASRVRALPPCHRSLALHRVSTPVPNVDSVLGRPGPPPARRPARRCALLVSRGPFRPTASGGLARSLACLAPVYGPDVPARPHPARPAAISCGIPPTGALAERLVFRGPRAPGGSRCGPRSNTRFQGTKPPGWGTPVCLTLACQRNSAPARQPLPLHRHRPDP